MIAEPAPDLFAEIFAPGDEARVGAATAMQFQLPAMGIAVPTPC
jgi:hypothetical protein